MIRNINSVPAIIVIARRETTSVVHLVDAGTDG